MDWTVNRLILTVGLALLLSPVPALAGCSDDPTAEPIDLDTADEDDTVDASGQEPDTDNDLDAGHEDIGDETNMNDASDTGIAPDTTDETDTGGDPDVDVAQSDTGNDDGNDSPPDGLSEPCKNGDGWTLLRFHYVQTVGTITVEVWDAPCSYSYGDETCGIEEVSPAFDDMPTNSDDFPIVNAGTRYISTRFSVEGLDFDSVTGHFRGRTYWDTYKTDVRFRSQLHGDATTGPVDNNSTQYNWYELDFSDHLFPDDEPDETSIDVLAASGGATELVFRAMEVCAQ